MFRWKKLGRIFNPKDMQEKSWMNEYAQSPSAIVFDNYIRVYFSSRPIPDKKGMFVSRMAYLDLSKENFKIINISKEPILPLGRLGEFDEFGTYPVSVINYKENIYAYYAGWTRCESVPFNAAIGMAISKDKGDTFNRVGVGPVISYSPDEPFIMGSPRIKRINNKFYLWYSSASKWIYNNGNPQPVYKIRMAESIDGINWVKQHKDIIKSVLEKDECQASAEVFEYQGRYHMLFSYRYNLNFKNPERGYRIGYASSSDLLNWSREDDLAGITTSENGWDSESVSYPNVFKLNNKIYMLYQGNEIGRFGFGLAEFVVKNKI